MKQLFRSKTNRVIAGICGGIGEMLNIDPVIIRLLVVFLCVITAIFPGVITYIIAMFIVPEKPD
ncbi:MAG: PspC domain-containing protein [Spirochaetales bacterium]|jgi:phage shock protein C|nr:PspC domain-containing protein [Exilispira sp.]NMC68134.1 PspC domain-containing protein [Spirochaetales bacterium]